MTGRAWLCLAVVASVSMLGVPASAVAPASCFAALYGVTAAAATNAWAVGVCDSATLIERWDGTAWTVVPSPDPGTGSGDQNVLDGVAAVPASGAWAVGWYGPFNARRTLILRWDGRRWQQVSSPSPGGAAGYNVLNAVAAVVPSPSS